jgi:hypothetical protein
MELMKQTSVRESMGTLPMGMCLGVVREGKPRVEVEEDEDEGAGITCS